MHVTGPGRFTTPAAAAPPASAGMPARGAGSSRPIRTALRRPDRKGLVSDADDGAHLPAATRPVNAGDGGRPGPRPPIKPGGGGGGGPIRRSRPPFGVPETARSYDDGLVQS